MAVTTRGGRKTLKPNRKVKWGVVWLIAGGALLLFVGIPLLNEFVLSAANRIELSPKDYVLPFIPGAVALFAAWTARPRDDEGVQS